MSSKACRSRRFLMASAVVVAWTAIAAAQTTPPPSPPAPAGDGHGDHRPGHQDWGHQDWQAQHAKMQERRLAELHTKLDLKPGQEPTWQAFVTGLHAARPTPGPHERPDHEKPDHEKPDWETMKLETTPERLDHRLARVDEMRAHLAQTDQVVKTFYVGLSKDQQTIFDDNFRMRDHGGGGPGGWDHHGGGHGPMDHGRGGRGAMGRPGGGPQAGFGASSAPPPQI